MLERFYKHYGYELDEQSREVQNFSLHYICSLNWKVWLCDVFGLNENGYEVQDNWVQVQDAQGVQENQIFGVQNLINNFQLLVVDDMQILSDKMSKMSIESTNKISFGLDINSIMKNMPLDYRFIY